MCLLEEDNLLYDVLDKIYPNWQYASVDIFYINFIAYLISNVFGHKELQQNITSNLRMNQIINYEKELELILKTPLKYIEEVMAYRIPQKTAYSMLVKNYKCKADRELLDMIGKLCRASRKNKYEIERKHNLYAAINKIRKFHNLEITNE